MSIKAPSFSHGGKHCICSITTTLLEKSADPEIQNESGNTALHYACLNGHPEVARVLLKYGAKATTVNAADRCSFPHPAALRG